MKVNVTFFIIVLSFLLLTKKGFAQTQFTSKKQQDSLIAHQTNERVWYNLLHYKLNIIVNPSNKTIKGTNTITYKVVAVNTILQIELQEPLKITAALQDKQNLEIEQFGTVYFIKLQKKQLIGSQNKITITYQGTPQTAINPPWDGGITWAKDANGLPFISSSCQGIGASVWYPNKDQLADEPDNGMEINVTVPDNLKEISNGKLVHVKNNKNGTKTFTWSVTQTINNYSANINIGDYALFSEEYLGENGTLQCDYYVLKNNLSKAKKHFTEVKRVLKAFEYWFGPYPFYQDSYKIVETPYLGMEHQSNIAYGNGFRNGYLGTDLSNTGWGLKFDFIIVHESGHEWFGNNISCKDVADLWIHEGFANYSELLFLEYHYGKEAANEYVQGLRNNINNDSPIIGTYNTNIEGSGDMYVKGANMLHTLRQIINNDEKWRAILRGLNKTFYHQTVTTAQVENYISQQSGIALASFFDQYLRNAKIPTLEYFFENNTLHYRWSQVVETFGMPIKVVVNNQEQWLNATTIWQSTTITDNKENKLVVDKNFYVNSLKFKR